MNIELSVVIPTLNEHDNMIPLMESLQKALEGLEWEAIFVDDASSDGTREIIEDLCRSDQRIQLINRSGRKGLASACLEGMQQCRADFIAVMDADLQHDETLLRLMLAKTKEDSLDIAIGSRYVQNAHIGPWPATRSWMSRCATGFVRRFLSRDIKDPLSGFFMIRREYFTGAERMLSGKGQKILLEILLSSPASMRSAELPYHFRKRVSGKSKLNLRVIWENILILCKKRG